MKRQKRLSGKLTKGAAKRVPAKGLTLMASIEEPERARVSVPNAEYYRPVKRAVTIRLDADVIAWFKKGGQLYQRRINRALREVMEREMKKG